MVDEAKSVDIKLYSVSKVEAAFEAAEVADEQPVADVVAAMRDRILEHLNAGRSISWVISVLQRGGIDLGSRQLRTYLQRAGIGVSSKRVAKGSSGGARRSAQKPKVADARESAVQASPVKDRNHADEAREVKVKTSCSESEAMCASGVQPTENAPAENETSAIAEAVQNATQDGTVQVTTGMDNAPAENVQAVSGGDGGAHAVQTHRSRKTGGRSFGADASGVLANGVQHGIIGFGQPDDDDLL